MNSETRERFGKAAEILLGQGAFPSADRLGTPSRPSHCSMESTYGGSVTPPRILSCNRCGMLYSEVQRGEGDVCWSAGVTFPNSPSQFTGCEGRLTAMRLVLSPESEVPDVR
jgi:hypothetical protein